MSLIQSIETDFLKAHISTEKLKENANMLYDCAHIDLPECIEDTRRIWNDRACVTFFQKQEHLKSEIARHTVKLVNITLQIESMSKRLERSERENISCSSVRRF